MKKYYGGIGSRQSPTSLKEQIKKIVLFLNDKDYVLRSGGADGTDSYFEEFAKEKEIYIPWENFKNKEGIENKSKLFQLTNEAYELAEKFHPNWSKVSYGAQKLLARNGYQVLGFDLKTPSEFIICWTKDGKIIGGTGQALRIAKSYNIPIFNLYNGSEEFFEYFKGK